MILNYSKLDTGVIRQQDVKPYIYNPTYVDTRYNQYTVLCDMMSHLRYGFIVGSIGKIPESILDVGYGNGSFLKITSTAGVESFGTDISNYPLEHGTFIDFSEAKNKPIDVITFFDSLEHFDDLDFVKDLNCKFICISVPNCNYNLIEEVLGEAAADEYFENWKHRRENEHIWHFDLMSLTRTMILYGYTVIKFAYIEDIIRKPVDSHHNILTMIFKKC
jgi:SAM-dependent methyltransferase